MTLVQRIDEEQASKQAATPEFISQNHKDYDHPMTTMHLIE